MMTSRGWAESIATVAIRWRTQKLHSWRQRNKLTYYPLLLYICYIKNIYFSHFCLSVSVSVSVSLVLSPPFFLSLCLSVCLCLCLCLSLSLSLSRSLSLFLSLSLSLSPLSLCLCLSQFRSLYLFSPSHIALPVYFASPNTSNRHAHARTYT